MGGNGDTHCCWLEGEVCPYLEVNTMLDRKWVCGLMRELGDWEQVIASDRYLSNVDPVLSKYGINCRDYPGVNHKCHDCGYGV